MAPTYFRVPLSVRPMGGGRAELVPPKALQALSYRFVVVNDSGDEGIVQLDEPRETLAGVQKDKNLRRLTKKQLETARSSYPAPKLKETYRRGPQAPAAADNEAGNAVVQTDQAGNQVAQLVQTVRSGFYLIDVPVVPPEGKT